MAHIAPQAGSQSPTIAHMQDRVMAGAQAKLRRIAAITPCVVATEHLQAVLQSNHQAAEILSSVTEQSCTCCLTAQVHKLADLQALLDELGYQYTEQERYTGTEYQLLNLSVAVDGQVVHLSAMQPVLADETLLEKAA